MRAKTLQIVWHGKEPVYSLDFHPNGSLVTGGADKEVKVWKVERGEDGFATVEHVSSMTGHSKTVNCVRFSPTGQHLATSGDGGEMLLWQPSDGAAARGNLEAEEGEATWKRVAGLRGHNDDVMDLAWSTDGTALLSGSIDNKAIVWDMSEKRQGTMLAQLSNHKHFVQGVAWDPAQQFVVTQSADRTCKVYTLRPPAASKRTKVSQYLLPAADTARELYCAHTLSKRAVVVAGAAGGCEDGGAGAQRVDRQPLFLDESVPSFFRRLAWSPDGAFLVVPAGTARSPSAERDVNTAYVYARGHWAAPVMHLPNHGKPVVAVRFCPVLYRREDDKAAAAAAAEAPPPPRPGAEGSDDSGCAAAASAPAHPFDLPYRMVFAVATLDSVVIYDTASALPLAVLGGLHYDSITDMAWSSDGQYLAVASRDCYCSVAAFDAGELGTPIAAEGEALPPHIARRMAAAQHVAAPLAPQQPAGVPGSSSKAKAPSPTPTSHARPERSAPEPPLAPGSAAASKPGSGSQPGAAAVEQRQEHGARAVGADGRKRIQAETLATYPQPAAKKAKRVVPEAIGPARGAAAPLEAQCRQVAPPEATLAEPAGAAGSCLGTTDSKTGPADPAAEAPPSSCGVTLGAKQAKRITPTPLKYDGEFSVPFETAKQAPRGLVAEGQPLSSTHRRITPIPVGAGTLLPSSSTTPAPAGKPPTPPESAHSVGEVQPHGGRINIAALALQAGQSAARATEGQQRG